MQKSCTHCADTYEISEGEKKFHAEFDVPAPRQCPHCRFIRRLVERNARNLYKRTCDLTGLNFISPYNNTVPFPVYHPDEWFSDAWDVDSYGKEIDWNTPFFDQLKTLFDSVPRMGQFICPGTIENSDYVNCAGYVKDCYLVAETDYNERCLYGNRVFHSNYVVDCSNIVQSELCYECVDVLQCHSCMYCMYCIDCTNCSGCYFGKNCIGCKDCIGCMNVRQKQYCVFNKQLTKDEYEQRKKEFNLDTYTGIENLRNQATEFTTRQPHRYVQMEQTENCTGDHLYDSRNAIECVDCKDLEDCMYCARVFNVKTALDYTSWGDGSERIYYSASCGDHAYNLRFCTTCTTNNSDLTYCGHCTGCKNCFGCIGMKKMQYCILNKQYSQNEYEEMEKKLIDYMKSTGEWGEFFPQSFCSSGYNETIAAEYFPLTKQEALAMGYTWKEVLDEKPKVEKSIPASKLPQRIEDIPDDILKWAVVCEVSNRPFKIIKQELEFYRQLGISIPRLHPDERHNRRMRLRPSRTFYDRRCEKCGKDIHTTFAPDRPEIVYCERCYLQTIY